MGEITLNESISHSSAYRQIRPRSVDFLDDGATDEQPNRKIAFLFYFFIILPIRNI